LKKPLHLLSIATVLTLTSISSQAATDNLVYVAVDPCRVVDTRNAGGAITANTSRDFLASGTSAQLASQGGTTDCPAPRAGVKPLAISAYVLAVPPDGTSTAGVLTAFPAGDPDPAVGAGSTVNFAAQQVIGNTTTITLCDPTGSCPAGREFAILARSTDQQVVVDVQGYYYAAVGSCPDDMVANGDGCIDKYEASVWTTATGGTQLNLAGAGGSDDIVCDDNGSDCGATAANPIYARSEPSVVPSARITWYQATQACANMGKRLPTTAEWQMAASGTPSDTDGGCNTGGTIANTDANPTCISSIGALGMVGNVWELTADLDNTTIAAGAIGTSDAFLGSSFGGDFSNSGGSSSTKAVFGVAPGVTTGVSGKVGFRCVR